MIKKLIVLFTILLMFSTHAQAETNENKLNEAINILNQYGYTKNVETLKSYKVNIQFMPLYDVDFRYKTFYAITCDSNTDEKTYILIDSRLKKCDTRVLACLLLHESVHAMSKAGHATLQEEYTAHKAERDLFKKILLDNIDLKNNTIDELINRENKLLLLNDESIITMLQNSSNYKLILK